MNAYQLSLRHTPTILRRIVDGVPAERRAESLGEDRFTLLEMVCHLADYEDVFLDRMRATVERDLPEFERIDVSERAKTKKYAERDMDEELTVFENRRRDTITFLEERSAEELDRELVQSFGRMSLKEFVAVLTGHDLYHLEQASEYLRG